MKIIKRVNLSSVWVLPEEGYPVFYRYFRDRITWYEAEAVCQFHHAQLLTVDSSAEYDAARAYLKELDVVNLVWTGLKRASPTAQFMWPESKVMETEGYWLQELPKSEEALCAAVDPSADYRWIPLPCSGPQAAAFLCQMKVPSWAEREDGCMLTSLPSLTVTFLPEEGAIELVSDCGLEGTRRIACKGQANHDEMIKQLSCESSTESASSSVTSSSQPWDDQPTRHRRQSEVTQEMIVMVQGSTQPINTTQGMPAADELTTTTTEGNVAYKLISTQQPSTTISTTSTTTSTTTTTTTETPTTVTTTNEASSTTAATTTTILLPTQEPKKQSGGDSAVGEEVVRLAGDQAERDQEGGGPRPVLTARAPNVTAQESEEEAEKESHERLQDSAAAHVESSGGGAGGDPEVGGPADSAEEQPPDDLPDRPNRGRLLVRPQHHSFYPYFLNRVLG